MKKVNTKIILWILLFQISNIIVAQQPKNIILFLIDGLHWNAPELLKMPVFNSLINEGTYIQKSYVIIPHHPTIGDYSKFNSCSLPNPVLQEGTIFIKPENKFIQEVISPRFKTAFVVNTTAYRSIARGFTNCIMDPELSDDQVVEQSINILNNQNPLFMRIHLQSAGNIGQSVVSVSSLDKSYYRNIFGKSSPYVVAIENADRLLGQLISYLKESGKWNQTILIVTSDHGQSLVGWHPLFDEDSWITPLVIVGQGIAKNRRLPYFEHTNIAPTIACLLGVNKPNNDGGAGNMVAEIMEDIDISGYNPPQNIKIINQQIKEFNILKSRMIIAADKKSYFSNIIASLENENITPEPFYHQDRITDWYKAKTTKQMIDANEIILSKMRLELKEKE